MPSAANASAITCEVAGSSAGSSRASRCTTVTLDPKRANIWANSQPMNPPPTTTKCAGSSRSSRIEREVR